MLCHHDICSLTRPFAPPSLASPSSSLLCATTPPSFRSSAPHCAAPSDRAPLVPPSRSEALTWQRGGARGPPGPKPKKKRKGAVALPFWPPPPPPPSLPLPSLAAF